MCQLNVYCVPKSLSKEMVINIFNKCFNVSFACCIEDDKLLPELQKDCNLYAIAGMACNCGSIVALFNNLTHKITFEEYNENEKQNIINQAQDAKKLMQDPDYEKDKKTIQKQYFKKLKLIGDVKLYRSNFISSKTDNLSKNGNLTEIEKINLIDGIKTESENIFPVNGLKKIKYIKAMKFYERNKSMIDSFNYNFETIDEDLNYRLQSHKSEIQLNQKEYENLNQSIKDLLEKTSEIKIFAYWQDCDNPKIYSYKSIKQCDFSIDEISSLNYNQLLTITK